MFIQYLRNAFSKRFYSRIRSVSTLSLVVLLSSVHIASWGAATDNRHGGSPNVPVNGAPDDPYATPSVFAEGGGGRFKEEIQWLQWSNPDFYSATNGTPLHDTPEPEGRSAGRPSRDGVVLGENGNPDGIPSANWVINYRDYGNNERLVTTCVLSDLDLSDTRPNKTPGPLVATVPGNWRGDSLDNLYNIGGARGQQDGHPASGTVDENTPNPNRMVIGLANAQWNAVQGEAGHGATPKFNVSCSSQLWEKENNGTYSNPRPVDINGLVIADAESAGYDGRVFFEWLTATAPEDTQWHLLDRLVEDQRCRGTATATIATSLDNSPAGQRTIRLRPNGSECGRGLGGPGSVMFMEGTTSATISFQGNGVQAVALGLIITTDFGDAPESYGVATALFQASWDSPIDTTPGAEVNLFDDQVAPLAHMRTPSTLLGKDVTDERSQPFSSTAGLDEKDDALTQPEDLIFSAIPGAVATRDISCIGPGVVAGWIDWNGNQHFDEATEKSTETPCTNGTAQLQWNIPDDVKRAQNGDIIGTFNSFMRIRIAEEPGLPATGTTLTGEVEDYPIQIRTPFLELINHVVNDYANPGAEATDWTVTAQKGNSHEKGQLVTNQGHAPSEPVEHGDFFLTATGNDGNPVPGYTASEWNCHETPNTSHDAGEPPYSSTYSADSHLVTVKETDHVTCEITHTALPGSVAWSKVDADGATPLEASVWTLSGPAYPGGVDVEDCVAGNASECTGLDTDERAGEFKVGKLKWGEYFLQEKTAPVGYELLTERLNFEPIVSTQLEAHLVDVNGIVKNGKVANIRSTGSMRWEKTDPHGVKLADSQWSLSGPGIPEGTVVTDCVETPCSPDTYADSDPQPGVFHVQNLESSTTEPYTVSEAVAPAGYSLDSNNNRQFFIKPTALNIAFTEPFVNTPIDPITLPLTGGMGTDFFLIAGTSVMGLSIALNIATRRRKHPH